MITLIDGDVVAYRAACSPVRYWCEFDGVYKKREPTLTEALNKCDDLMHEVINGSKMEAFDEDPCETFLTGKGNFRTHYAVTAEYKGNRKAVERPQWLPAVRMHMMQTYDATMSTGEEADDLLALRATELGPDRACIASTDKDMLQVNCLHYNITRKDFTFMTAFEGLKWFYGQLIEGDRADNIIGVKGIGPKKREKIHKDCTTEHDLHFTCVETFMDTGLTLEEATSRVLENGRLAWLRREVGQIWEPFTWGSYD